MFTAVPAGNPEYESEVNNNERKIQGVRLGDWIFNNSCENDGMVNHGREMYRKKICENWVISLENPKPKDTEDSLNFVEIDNIQHDTNVFKKPERPKRVSIRNSRSCIKRKSKTRLNNVLSQVYTPSENLAKFNNSSLMRASRKLITNGGNDFRNSTTTRSAKIPVESEADIFEPEISIGVQENNNWQSSFEKFFNITTPEIPPTEKPLPPLLPINNLDEPVIACDTPILLPNNDNRSHDHLQMYTSMKEIFDFKLHTNEQKSDFNMTFSSSVMHAMNDPFMGFFENNRSSVNTALNAPLSELNRRYGSSVCSQTSEVHYRQNRNNSFLTHHRRTETYRNFNRENSSTSSSRSRCHRSEINVRETQRRRIEHHRSKSIRSSSQSAVAPVSSSIVNDGIKQTGWPVTININFGQSK